MVSVHDSLEDRLRAAKAELAERERQRLPADSALSESQERRLGFVQRFLGKRDFERMESERAALESRLRAFDSEVIALLRHRVAAIEDMVGLAAMALKAEGAEPSCPIGEVFDPSRHESVGEEPAQSGQEPGRVVSVKRLGYSWAGQVLRPAQVVIAAAAG
jgi:molecular chaperone GrpE (heat shock protein)